MLKGLNPVWHDTMVFKVHAPELAFVIFTVFVKNLSIAHYALPYSCIQQGYFTCIGLFCFTAWNSDGSMLPFRNGYRIYIDIFTAIYKR